MSVENIPDIDLDTLSKLSRELTGDGPRMDRFLDELKEKRPAWFSLLVTFSVAGPGATTATAAVLYLLAELGGHDEAV